MSERRRTRRRFLADLLFAGGGLAVTAAFLRWPEDAPATPPRQPQIMGDYAPPLPVETPPPEVEESNVVRGRMQIPER